MKTLVTVIVVFVLSLSSLKAQHISIGPTAGFGHSYLNVEESNLSNKFFPSYNAGFKFVYSIVSHWGVSVDLKFAGEGGKASGNVLGDEFETKIRAHYIRIPIQGIYFFGKLGDAMRPKISLGPALGLLIGGEATQKMNGQEISSLKTRDVLEGFDFGINTALGANFRLKGDKWLNTDITYYHGLTNISASVSTIKNRSIGLNIGLTFPIGN